ncbi:MAG: hypothetical protein R2780_10370 [Crocinitomicaceae bacterium]|nr:hypothetical protein [Crocinitomicaceae bacterium]
MKKLIYISFVFAVILAFTSCKKEVIKPCSSMDETGYVRCGNGGNGSDIPYMVRGGEENLSQEGGGIVDPNEDPDFDGDDDIVDPNEDPDFDEDDQIVDPDEDEDFDEDEEDGK